MTLPAETALGAISLVVSDGGRQRRFYEDAIGLRTLDESDGAIRLGPAGGQPLVELVVRPDAPPRPPRTTGLFHLAILVPSRAELARAVLRVTGAGRRFTGASDHLVSEALYLDDPEGNGIEIYRDRPREDWPRVGGTLAMDTLPLDLDGVMDEVPDRDPGDGLAAATVLGHVHLQVADLAAAESFWVGAVGLDVSVGGFPGALFTSVGGYHHHVGLNTWGTAGAPAPPPGSRGLRWFELAVPDELSVADAAERLERIGPVERSDGAVAAADPSGNRVVVRAARSGSG